MQTASIQSIRCPGGYRTLTEARRDCHGYGVPEAHRICGYKQAHVHTCVYARRPIRHRRFEMVSRVEYQWPSFYFMLARRGCEHRFYRTSTRSAWGANVKELKAKKASIIRDTLQHAPLRVWEVL